jgi:hypothetical protein
MPHGFEQPNVAAPQLVQRGHADHSVVTACFVQRFAHQGSLKVGQCEQVTRNGLIRGRRATHAGEHAFFLAADLLNDILRLGSAQDGKAGQGLLALGESGDRASCFNAAKSPAWAMIDLASFRQMSYVSC